MTYPFLQCNSVLWLMIHFLHHNQDHRMLEIWMDHDNETKVRMVVADKPNQQFETMTYLHNQCNCHLWWTLHFHHHNQDPRMLEIWMDHDNNTKVRMVVADQSYQHLKRMTYHIFQCNSDHWHFRLYHCSLQVLYMLEIWIDMIMKQKLDWYNGQLR